MDVWMDRSVLPVVRPASCVPRGAQKSWDGPRQTLTLAWLGAAGRPVWSGSISNCSSTKIPNPEMSHPPFHPLDSEAAVTCPTRAPAAATTTPAHVIIGVDVCRAAVWGGMWYATWTPVDEAEINAVPHARSRGACVFDLHQFCFWRPAHTFSCSCIAGGPAAPGMSAKREGKSAKYPKPAQRCIIYLLKKVGSDSRFIRRPASSPTCYGLSRGLGQHRPRVSLNHRISSVDRIGRYLAAVGEGKQKIERSLSLSPANFQTPVARKKEDRYIHTYRKVLKHEQTTDCQHRRPVASRRRRLHSDKAGTLGLHPNPNPNPNGQPSSAQYGCPKIQFSRRACLSPSESIAGLSPRCRHT